MICLIFVTHDGMLLPIYLAEIKLRLNWSIRSNLSSPPPPPFYALISFVYSITLYSSRRHVRGFLLLFVHWSIT
jgi:hypothetical protein